MQKELIILPVKRKISFNLISLSSLLLCHSYAYAIGLGEANLRSSLGQNLLVQIPIEGFYRENMNSNCVKATVDTLNDEFIAATKVEFIAPVSEGKNAYIKLTTRHSITEPAIKLLVSVSCGQNIQRQYALLLDLEDANSNLADSLPKNSVQVEPAKILNSTQVEKNSVNNPSAKREKVDSDKTTQVNGKKDSEKIAISVNKQKKQASQQLTDADHPPLRLSKKIAHSKPQNVLRISNDNVESNYDLKFSEALTVPSNAPLDAQRANENRLAQQRYEALIHDHDLVAETQNREKTSNQKIATLESDLISLKHQNATTTEQVNSYKQQIYGMLVAITLLILSLLGLIYFYVFRQKTNTDKAWWMPKSEKKQQNLKNDLIEQSSTTNNFERDLQNDKDAGQVGVTKNLKTHTDSNQSVIEINPQTTSDQNKHARNKSDPSPRYKRMGLPALEDTVTSTFNFLSNRAQSIQIAEVSDVTQEAEFWVSVNDPHRAIELLELQNPNETGSLPVTWLYLLDLYRMVEDQAKYEKLREKFVAKFNAKIPEFDTKIDKQNLKYVEDLPHVLEKCCLYWHTKKIIPYLESLVIDDRQGERNGFELSVYKEILFLLNVCHELERNNPVDAETKIEAETNDFVTDFPTVSLVPDSEFIHHSTSLDFDLTFNTVTKKD